MFEILILLDIKTDELSPKLSHQISSTNFYFHKLINPIIKIIYVETDHYE
jgi:hypothetical protein